MTAWGDSVLRGQVAVVTGGGGGIGAAIAAGFGRAGARVIVHYHRNGAGAEQVVADVEGAGGEAVAFGADLTAEAGVGALVEVAGGAVDILVNNAGDLVARSSFCEVSDELYDAIVDVNIGTAFRVIRAFLPQMLQRGSGSIINLTSVAARNGGGTGSVMYAAAKGAVSTMTRGLAKEVARAGVRVNAIAPGVIDTSFHERHSSPQVLQQMLATIPMGRIGVSEDCIGAAIFLASAELSGYVTGQILEVNGGQYMP